MSKIVIPYGEQKSVISIYYDEYEERLVDCYCYMIAGTYAKVKKTPGNTLTPRAWYSCRECFQDDAKGIKWMLFCHKPNKGYSISYFIHHIERKLRLRTFSTFGPTQSNKLTWICASSWWMVNSMRRSFFTALLRAAQQYRLDKDNTLGALWSNRYLRQSKYATLRFLRGYTKYTGHINGWNNQFFWGGEWNKPKPPTPEEVRKLLIKP